jgi:ferritin-like metal-binding protein YciE
MMARRETLLAWLRDAHAMERATIDNLQRQVERTDEYPQLQAKLEEHLDQSRDQLRRVEDCLHRLGTDPSMVKDAATRLTGYVETWLAGMAPDEIVKNCMATYAFEHFEVASYRALAAAAQECGELDVMRVCEEILDEEQAMADWLHQYLPEITREYLRREAKAPANGGIARAGSMLREHPIPAAIAAAGLGFAIAAGSRGAFRRSGRRQSVQRRRAAMW